MKLNQIPRTLVCQCPWLLSVLEGLVFSQVSSHKLPEISLTMLVYTHHAKKFNSLLRAANHKADIEIIGLECRGSAVLLNGAVEQVHRRERVVGVVEGAIEDSGASHRLPAVDRSFPFDLQVRALQCPTIAKGTTR